MTRLHLSIAGAVACAAVIGLFALLPQAVSAQGNAVVSKIVADLAPPVGATDTTPKGKANAQHKLKGDALTQKLAITLQHLEKKTEYDVVIVGVSLGIFKPKGNSGTLVLRYRDPARGNQTQLPEELGPLTDLQTIQVFKVETGELILEGAFELVE